MAPRSASPTAATLIAVLLASIAVFQIAIAARPRPADLARAALESRLDALAGAGAESCGNPFRSEPLDLGCARAAMLARRPFRLVRVHQGIDDAITVGYAGDREGRLWEVSFAQFASWPGSELEELPLHERRCWFPDPASDFERPCGD